MECRELWQIDLTTPTTPTHAPTHAQELKQQLKAHKKENKKASRPTDLHKMLHLAYLKVLPHAPQGLALPVPCHTSPSVVAMRGGAGR